MDEETQLAIDRKIVAVFSGGLDSTTMLYDLLANGWEITTAVTFYYGQKHKKEIEYAKATCEKLSIKHVVIDLDASGMTAAFNAADPTRALLSDSADEIPDGHYTKLTMKDTVVPNRNMIMLAIAGGIAVVDGASGVAIGVHQGDHFIYPDCRRPFIEAAAFALKLGNQGFGNIQGVMAPFLEGDKTNIAKTALLRNVPIHESWSCYKGGDIHCGRCGTCVERLEAINDARLELVETFPEGVYPEDQTEYADTEFWKMEVAMTIIERGANEVK